MVPRLRIAASGGGFKESSRVRPEHTRTLQNQDSLRTQEGRWRVTTRAARAGHGGPAAPGRPAARREDAERGLGDGAEGTGGGESPEKEPMSTSAQRGTAQDLGAIRS